jgi:hypothetical protein
LFCPYGSFIPESEDGRQALFTPEAFFNLIKKLVYPIIEIFRIAEPFGGIGHSNLEKAGIHIVSLW